MVKKEKSELPVANQFRKYSGKVPTELRYDFTYFKFRF